MKCKLYRKKSYCQWRNDGAGCKGCGFAKKREKKIYEFSYCYHDKAPKWVGMIEATSEKKARKKLIIRENLNADTAIIKLEEVTPIDKG